MKFWNNPFEQKNIKLCICGLEDTTIKAMPEIVGRKISLNILGLCGFVLLAIFVGFNDPRVWPLYGIELLLLLPVTVGSILNIKKGHRLNCAIRKATYTSL